MAPSPWGWYFPMTSPLTRAHFSRGRSLRAPMSCMPQRIRRCTGLRPSRASGRARLTMTDMEYSRNERSISSWISMGSIPAIGPPPSSTLVIPAPPSEVPTSLRVGSARLVARPRARSYVQEPHVLGVGHDEVLPQLDVVTHEDADGAVGQRRLLHRHLEQRAPGRVHGRLPELLPVHLAEALQAVELVLLARVLGQEPLAGGVVLQVLLLLAHRHRVEGRLGDVHVAGLDQRLHVAVEEGQQQRADVAAVDVGVGGDDHLVVADLLEVEVLAEAGADGLDHGPHLGVLQHLVDAGPLDVQELAPDGEQRLDAGVAGPDGRAAGGVALDHEQLGLARVARRAVAE